MKEPPGRKLLYNAPTQLSITLSCIYKIYIYKLFILRYTCTQYREDLNKIKPPRSQLECNSQSIPHIPYIHISNDIHVY